MLIKISHSTLYVGRPSQKAANLSRDDRVSVTVDHEAPDVTDISGLSMAAHAQTVVNPAEASKALQMLRLRYPLLPVPMPEDVLIFRVKPTIICGPIEKGKAVLAKLLKGQQTSIVFNQVYEEDGAVVFREGCNLGCEGRGQ